MEKTTITKDEVITRLKDDGDFDKLRLKIIRKIKDNEELRNNIVSVVRQSAVFNRADAENLKPRQLLDAIHEDVKNKLMSQLSDNVWDIIRSEDGMKSEIKETVQSVYNRVLNPTEKEEGTSSIAQNAMLLHKEADNNGSATALPTNVDETQCNNEVKGPPGFSLYDHGLNNCDEQQKEEPQLPMFHENFAKEEQKALHQDSQNLLGPDGVDHNRPPGFSTGMEQMQAGDEDPDVPPGFG